MPARTFTIGPVARSALSGKRAGLEMFAAVPQIITISGGIGSETKRSGSGLTTTVQYANGSITKAEQDIQTFLAQAYNGVWTTLSSTVGLEPLAAQAKQSNIPWVNFSGSAITGATTNIVTDNYHLGYLVGQESAHWMQAHGKTSAAVGATEGTNDGTNTAKTTGFTAGLRSVLPSVKVYVAADNGQTSTGGETAGQNLLGAHPNIAVLYGWFSQDAVGLEQAARQAGKTDPNAFLISTDETDNQVMPLIAGRSVLQLALDQNDALVAIPGTRLLQEAMAGKKIPPTAFVRPTIVTPANVGAVEKRDADPAAYPNALNHVLQFSDVSLTSSATPNANVTPIGA